MLSRKEDFCTDSTKDNCENKLKETERREERKRKRGRRENRKEKRGTANLMNLFPARSKRNHSRTKVSRFKAGRVRRVRFRESKNAGENTCTMPCIYIVWRFVIMHATFVNIFSVTV